jgi:hypothetical protein
MNYNHRVAEFPLDHPVPYQFHQSLMDVWETVENSKRAIRESQELLARVDLLVSSLIE